MKLWAHWPRWLKITGWVMVPLVGILGYLAMVNVVLSPQVILEVRSEVPGVEIWMNAQRRGTAPLDIDASEQWGRAINHPFWDPVFWKSGSNVAWWMMKGLEKRWGYDYHFIGSWFGSVADLGDGEWDVESVMLSARLGDRRLWVRSVSLAPPPLFQTCYWTRVRRIPVRIVEPVSRTGTQDDS